MRTTSLLVMGISCALLVSQMADAHKEKPKNSHKLGEDRSDKSDKSDKSDSSASSEERPDKPTSSKQSPKSSGAPTTPSNGSSKTSVPPPKPSGSPKSTPGAHSSAKPQTSQAPRSPGPQSPASPSQKPQWPPTGWPEGDWWRRFNWWHHKWDWGHSHEHDDDDIEWWNPCEGYTGPTPKPGSPGPRSSTKPQTTPNPSTSPKPSDKPSSGKPSSGKTSPSGAPITTTAPCSPFLKAVCGNLLYAKDGQGPFGNCSVLGEAAIREFYQSPCLPQICAGGSKQQCLLYEQFADLCDAKLPEGGKLDQTGGAWRNSYGCPADASDSLKIQIVPAVADGPSPPSNSAKAKPASETKRLDAGGTIQIEVKAADGTQIKLSGKLEAGSIKSKRHAQPGGPKPSPRPSFPFPSKGGWSFPPKGSWPEFPKNLCAFWPPGKKIPRRKHGHGHNPKNCDKSAVAYFDDFNTAFAVQNATRQAAFYSDKAVITTNKYGILDGNPAVVAFFKGVFEQGFNRAKVDVDVVETDKDCKWAMIVARFKLDSKEGKPGVLTSGIFWKVMKKEEGRWRADIERLNFTA